MDYKDYIISVGQALNVSRLAITDSVVGITSKNIKQVKGIIDTLMDKITYNNKPVYFEQIDATRSKYRTELFDNKKVYYYCYSSQEDDNNVPVYLDIVYYLFEVDTGDTVFYVSIYKN